MKIIEKTLGVYDDALVLVDLLQYSGKKYAYVSLSQKEVARLAREVGMKTIPSGSFKYGGINFKVEKEVKERRRDRP